MYENKLSVIDVRKRSAKVNFVCISLNPVRKKHLFIKQQLLCSITADNSSLSISDAN